MYAFCQYLNVKDRAAVESANMKMICGANGKESVEEFIMRVECQSKGCPVANGILPVESTVPGVELWEVFDVGGDGFQDFGMLGQ